MSINLTEEDFDKILHSLNTEAYEYENRTIKEAAHRNLNVIEIINEEVEKRGSGIVKAYMTNVICILGRYRNTAVNEGDIVTLNDEDFEEGTRILKQNPSIYGEYILPVLLYSLQYKSLVPLYFPHIDDKIIACGKTFESYDTFFRMVVGTAIQARFWHIRQCHIQNDLGNDEYAKTNFGDKKITEGRLIGEDER